MTTHTTSTLRLIVHHLAIIVGVALMLVGTSVSLVRAESVSWNTVYNGGLCSTGGDTENFPCATFLFNPNITVNENIQITNADTGAPIAPGSSVPQGTRLRLQFSTHQSQDIAWFGTGASIDSPYGEWVGGAGEGSTCDDKNYVTKENNTRSIPEPIYFNLSISPPGEWLNGTDGLGCNSDGVCNTPNPGTYNTVFHFDPTYGHFYGYYYSSNTDENGEIISHDCLGGPAYKGTMYFYTLYGYTYWRGTAGYFYTLQIPARQISFPITVTSTSVPPNTPTIDEVGSCTTGTAHSYTLKATDTDTSATLRYGMDWNNDGTVDEWIPASGYVPQGTPQTATHTWSTSGSHTFRVLAEDAHGTDSAWATHTVSCAQPTNQLPTALLTANPQSVTSGSASTLQWSSANATQCTGTGFNTNGATSGSVSTGPLAANTPYSVTCTNESGSANDNTIVTITTSNSCPTGQHWNGTQCVIDSCPTNYHWNGTQCVIDPSCPAGQHWNGTQCVSDCPTGQHWNGTQCVIDPCSSGYHWNGTRCVSECTNNTCTVPSPLLIKWKVTPILVRSGNTVSVSWDVQHVSSCTVTSTNSDSWTGLSGIETSKGIPAQTIFSLHCAALPGSNAADVDKATTVNIIPGFQER